MDLIVIKLTRAKLVLIATNVLCVRKYNIFGDKHALRGAGTFMRFSMNPSFL